MRGTFRLCGTGSMTCIIALFMLSNAFAGGGGTMLRGTKTAEASMTRTTTFDWTIQKTIPPEQVTFVVSRNMTVPANFTITATRASETVVSRNGPVTGEICITNVGRTSTVGLAIDDFLQEDTGGDYQDIASQALPISHELEPGQSRCYPYRFEISLDPQGVYRNVAIVSIDNYYNHEGTSWGITLQAPVVVTTTAEVIDQTAQLTDTFTCPSGFTCEPLTYEENLDGSKTIAHAVILTNVSASCGQTVSATDNVTLIEQNTQERRTASASIQVYTGTCRR